ncbi:MAG TPA: DUF6691 family protein [Planctomycetota bacterium]|nr:DUF6691 family protein [Planctomycetota bacterium]
MNPLILGLLIGVVFGAALVLAGFSNPRLIVEMLRLRDLRLARALGTALAVGVLGVALLDTAGLAHTGVKTLHVAAILAGGSIFGVGFALAGYCPGTALAGAAEGRADAPFAVLGGLAGTAAFAALYDVLRPALIDPWTFGKPTFASALGLHPLAVALALGGAALWLLSVLRRREARHGEAAGASGAGPADYGARTDPTVGTRARSRAG